MPKLPFESRRNDVTSKYVPLWMLLAMSCAACSDSDDPAGEREDPEEEACDRATDPSEGTPIIAAQARDSAPALELSEEPYLVELEQGTRGYVRLTGPVDALLFVAQADAVTSLTLEGTMTDVLPEGAPVEQCSDDIPEHFDLELEETGDYSLELTTADPPLWLVYTTAEGHAHE
jgi:hypothetical protein